MVAFTIAMMFSAAVTLPNYRLPPEKPRRCSDACAARYRIPASSNDRYSLKDRALANDGTKCNVVGARRCAAKRHTVLRAALSDD
ncbi:MAG: hypothetical protein ABIQ43_00745 [Sphingomonas sp.]